MTTYLTPTEVQQINSLPFTSATVLRAILEGLYAEPGFSDVDVRDVVKATKLKQKVVKGALSHLMELGLATPDEVEINGKTCHFLHSDLHRDVRSLDGSYLPDGVVKAEAIKLLDARLGATRFGRVALALLVKQQVSPVTEVKKPRKAAITKRGSKDDVNQPTGAVTFKAGPGILNVMQWDDESMRDSYGITILHQTKDYVTLQVRAGRITELLSALNSRAKGSADGWAQPLWYAASAAAAAKSLIKALLEVK